MLTKFLARDQLYDNNNQASISKKQNKSFKDCKFHITQ